MDLAFLTDVFWKIGAGVPVTILLVVQSLLLGFVLAVLVALMRLSDNRVVSGAAYGFVYVFRSTPLLVQIFLIYYGSGQFRPFLRGAGALGVLPRRLVLRDPGADAEHRRLYAARSSGAASSRCRTASSRPAAPSA